MTSGAETQGSATPPRTRIKVCGVRREEIALAAAEAGADAVGLVRVERSPRFVDADLARRIAGCLPPWTAPVAVVADQPVDDILGEWPHDWIQLHGQELDVDPHLAGRRVIKALPSTASDEALLWWDANPRVAALLIDAPRAGGGEPFDHARLASVRARLTKPLILAGGLVAETVGEAIRMVRPWAVDVSSGVERRRGEKDADLIAEFCAAVRHADDALRAALRRA